MIPEEVKFENLSPAQQAEWLKSDALLRDMQAIIECPYDPSYFRSLSGDEMRKVIEDPAHPRHDEFLTGMKAAVETKKQIDIARGILEKRKPSRGDHSPLPQERIDQIRVAIARELLRVRHGWVPRMDLGKIFNDVDEIDRVLAHHDGIRGHLLAALDESVVRREQWEREAVKRAKELDAQRGNPIFRK